MRVKESQVAQTFDSAKRKTQSPETGLLKLRVRAFRRGGFWHAECLDLALVARRDSEAAALRALLEQIRDYLTGAFESGASHDLVPRHSPRSHFAQYYVEAVVEGILRWLRPTDIHTYQMPFDPQGRCLCA